MSWAIGYDTGWKRDIGYGVPAHCDHPGCMAKIDRGLGYVCGGQPYGGERGCGLYFCEKHHTGRDQKCSRCTEGKDAWPARRDHPQWIRHKLNHYSWKEWRAKNPEAVKAMQTEAKP